MSIRQHSLHEQVERWLSPTPATPARVAEFIRTRDGNRRYVCVEVARPECSVAMMFFRHDGGSWRVFPPRRECLAMAILKAA